MARELKKPYHPAPGTAIYVAPPERFMVLGPGTRTRIVETEPDGTEWVVFDSLEIESIEWPKR